MASIVKVETLQDTAGNNAVAMQYVSKGTARVHVRANLATPGITGSLGVSSLVDNYTGSGKPQFTNNFAALDYTCVIAVGISGDVVFPDLQADGTTKTFEHRIMGRAGNETGIDWDIGTSICMGNLA